MALMTRNREEQIHTVAKLLLDERQPLSDNERRVLIEESLPALMRMMDDAAACRRRRDAEPGNAIGDGD